MKVTIVREPTIVSNGCYYTLGKLYIDNVYFCRTLEPDDNLSKGTKTYNGKKVKEFYNHHHFSAIPVSDKYTIFYRVYEKDSGFNKVGGFRGLNHRGNFNSTKEEEAWLNEIRKQSTNYVKNTDYQNVGTLYCPWVNNTWTHSGILFHNGANYLNTEGCIVVGTKDEKYEWPTNKFRDIDINTWVEFFKKLWDGGLKNGKRIPLEITYDDKGLKKIEVNQEQQESSKPSRC